MKKCCMWRKNLPKNHELGDVVGILGDVVGMLRDVAGMLGALVRSRRLQMQIVG